MAASPAVNCAAVWLLWPSRNTAAEARQLLTLLVAADAGNEQNASAELAGLLRPSWATPTITNQTRLVRATLVSLAGEVNDTALTTQALAIVQARSLVTFAASLHTQRPAEQRGCVPWICWLMGCWPWPSRWSVCLALLAPLGTADFLRGSVLA